MTSLLKTFREKSSSFIPLWLMRQAGRYLPEYQAVRKEVGGFMNLCFTPDAIVEVTLQPIRRFELDAAIIFSDILVIPHAMGQSLSFQEKKGPILQKITDWTDFLDENEKKKTLESLDPVLMAIGKIRKKLPSKTSLIGFTGSPWTIATYMIEGGKSTDFATILSWIEKKPEELNRLITILSEKISHFLIEQIKSGVDVIKIFDTWASKVPLKDRPSLLINPIQNILNHVRKFFPDIPIIYFAKGVPEIYQKLEVSLFCGAFGPETSLLEMKNYQQSMIVQGNLSPEILVKGGEILMHNVQSILKNLAQGPFIFNLGHGILPETPVDHVYKLVELVRSYVPEN
jgi:uroporphyrinogen decarboxylase